MNEQNPNLTAVPTPSKKSFKERASRVTTPARKHAKNVFAVVGVASVGLYAASKFAKDKGVDSVTVDLPSVDVTTNDS